jgi:hypothetical protein
MPISQILLTAGSYSGPRVSWSNIYYSNVNEGQQNTVYLDFRDWVDSTVYWWIVDEGNNQISNGQLSSATSGTFSPGFGDYTNYESFNFTFAEDATTDGELTYYIRIENADGQLLMPRQGPFTVNDTSQTPEQVEVSAGEVREVTDEEVIKQLEQQGGEDYFTSYHMKQRDELARETEKYMKIITDPEASTQAISSAMTAMQQLEDRSEQVTDLQEKLQQHFSDVIIEQKNENLKVIVQAGELKRDQAVHIVQMVTESLKIAPERVSVQYRQ